MVPLPLGMPSIPIPHPVPRARPTTPLHPTQPGPEQLRPVWTNAGQHGCARFQGLNVVPTDNRVPRPGPARDGARQQPSCLGRPLLGLAHSLSVVSLQVRPVGCVWS